MPAATIDEYLAGVPDDSKRAALERLREQIRAAAPDATETIAYGVPGYRLDGHYLLGFAANKHFCSFYVGHGAHLEHADELKGFRLAKGTISFTAGKPLPEALVTLIVQERVAEFRAR